jgi:hypothetical protein
MQPIRREMAKVKVGEHYLMNISDPGNFNGRMMYTDACTLPEIILRLTLFTRIISGLGDRIKTSPGSTVVHCVTPNRSKFFKNHF